MNPTTPKNERPSARTMDVLERLLAAGGVDPDDLAFLKEKPPAKTPGSRKGVPMPGMVIRAAADRSTYPDVSLDLDEDELALSEGWAAAKPAAVAVAETEAIIGRLDTAKAPPKEERYKRSSADTTIIEGVEKRVVTLESLNERYAILQAPGAASIYVSRPDFLAIQDADLKRRLANEVVATGIKDGRPTYKAAFTAWNGNARRHVYKRVVFTSKPVSSDSYNLFKGLGVIPKPGNCGLIIRHIEEVLCSRDKDFARVLIKLLAWQLQHIGEPSRIAVILMNEKQQAGKGVILEEVMAKIYGPSGMTPSAMDQIVGRFNDTIRGCAFAFLDEVLFAGDRKAADTLKGLITTTGRGIETKGLPIVQCPVAINLWFASNHKNAAHLEEHDARYLVLSVSEHRRGDAAYFAALMKEINGGGREAFAHHLLNLDVSDFVPWRDIKKDNEAKRDMIRESVNPYDARKWLEDCCDVERVIGRPDTSGEWKPWNEGEEYAFAALCAAYVDWQRTVKSPVAPIPTKVGNLGEVLTQAGFGLRRTNRGAIPILPPLETCLEALLKAW
jgi:hypothetical protein